MSTLRTDNLQTTDSSITIPLSDIALKSGLQSQEFVVNSVADMKAVSSLTYPTVVTLGYYTKGDGGGGTFYADSTDTTTVDNGGSCIIGNDGVRRKRVQQGATSVKAFGAKGDGVNDDTLAINKCLANSQSTYFPATLTGYRITGTLTIPNSGSNVFGDGGSQSSFLNLNNQTFDIFTVTAIVDVEIRDLFAIDYANRGSSPTQMYFARFDDTSKFKVINCGGYNIHSGILAGKTGGTGGGANSRMEGLNFNKMGAATGVGVHYGGNGELRELLNCVFAGPGSGADGTVNAGAGVRITGGTAIVMDNIEAPGCGVPLLIQPPANGQVAHTKISKFWCDSSSSIGMWLDGSASNAKIIDTNIDQSWFSSNGVGIRLSGFVTDCVIMQSEVYQNRSDGIIIDSNSNVLGLLIGGGTRIAGNTGSGIGIGLNIGGFRITDCNVGTSSHFGANANGIFMAGGNDNYDISHNAIYGNAGQQIAGHSQGTSTRIVKNNIGFTTEAESQFSGATDASGQITLTHNMGRVPTVLLPVMFGGGSTNSLDVQVVSIGTNTAVVKVFSNNVPLASTTVTVYFRAFY